MTDESKTQRIELPGGYYLFQLRPDHMACSLHMADGLHIGNLLGQYAGDFAAALHPTPAPVETTPEIEAALKAWFHFQSANNASALYVRCAELWGRDFNPAEYDDVE